MSDSVEGLKQPSRTWLAKSYLSPFDQQNEGSELAYCTTRKAHVCSEIITESFHQMKQISLPPSLICRILSLQPAI